MVTGVERVRRASKSGKAASGKSGGWEVRGKSAGAFTSKGRQDAKIQAMARKMADADLEILAQRLLSDIVTELKALNADIAAQNW